MSLAAATVAAGALAAGSSLGQSIYSTERNIANSNWQAYLDRDLTERLANTQYQRAVSDMEAAGLNPAAIGAGLSSNASPSSAAGATANYGHPVASDFGNIFSSAVKAAMSRDRNVSNKILQEMKDETALQVQYARNEGMVQNEIQKKALGHSAYRVREASAGSERYSNQKVPWKEL